MVELHSGYEGATIARGTVAVSHVPCAAPRSSSSPRCLPLRPATNSQLRNAAVMMSARPPIACQSSATSAPLLLLLLLLMLLLLWRECLLLPRAGGDLSAATAQPLVPVSLSAQPFIPTLDVGGSTLGCWQMGEWAVQPHTSSRYCFSHGESSSSAPGLGQMFSIISTPPPHSFGHQAGGGGGTRIFIQLSSLFWRVQPRL